MSFLLQLLVLFAALCCCSAQTASCALPQSSVRNGTDCVAANSRATDSEAVALYFCTDRYIWKWSEEPVNLPYPWSDSAAVSFDSAAVPGLARTIMMVYSGCQQDSQPTDGQCSNLTSDSYLYSPTANEFKQGAVMPDERWRFAATNVSEHVYVFGGRNISDALQCTVQVYDVLMNEWTVMPASSDWKNCTSDGAAFSVNGVIYLVGGYTADYESKATVTKVTITKDAAGKPTKLTYSAAAPLTTDRGDHSCWIAPDSTQAYCMGGFSSLVGFDTPLDTVEMYDATTNTWTGKKPMPTARGDFALGYLNGRLTVVAGERFSDSLGHSTGIKSVEWYNPVTDCWTDSNALFDLPYPRFRCSAAVFPEQNRIFVFGGQSPAINGAWPLTDDVFVYEETDADAVGDSSTPSTGSSAALYSSSAGAVAAAAVTALLCLLA